MFYLRQRLPLLLITLWQLLARAPRNVVSCGGDPGNARTSTKTDSQTRRCAKDVCHCDHGTPVDEKLNQCAGDGKQACASCDDGYHQEGQSRAARAGEHLSDFGGCGRCRESRANPRRTSALALCEHLRRCAKNECTCENGTPVDPGDALCKIDGSVACAPARCECTPARPPIMLP